MGQPLSFLDHNADRNAAIFFCDADLVTEDDSTHKYEVLEQFPVYLKIDEQWHQTDILSVRDPLLANDRDVQKILERQRLKATVLVNSYGGGVEAGNMFSNCLLKGRREHKWETQTIIGSMAASIAADIAITPDKIYGTENARLLFHVGEQINRFVPKKKALNKDTGGPYGTLYGCLHRLRQLAADPVAFQRAQIEKRFQDVLDRPRVDPDDDIELTGEQLKKATVMQQEGQDEIEKALHEVLTMKMPEALRERLSFFLSIIE